MSVSPAISLTPAARPELLAPAGDWDCARAAVENGADAIYFGLDHGFNARARAHNFAMADLPELMAFLHQRGVRGYVTLNVLVFPSELPQLEETARAVAAAGVDAVLVQDVGAARLIRALCPDLPLHASTQMTLTSAECIEVARSLGIERVVLARELSAPEIGKIHGRTTMPLETFVHGALCVAYSGQCLTSESLGGRSANRGQCAQACRLPYELVCDGKDVDLGDQRYLLSPQDLAAFELVPDLIAAGVTCFKIEGRLKTPEYVANITRHYRRAIDAAMAGRTATFSPQDVEEMQLSFSRGFSPGWLGGCDHKMLVPALSSSKRGVFLGTVRGVQGERVTVELACRIKPGDGVVFDGDRMQGEEQGGRVYEVFRGGKPPRPGEETTTGIVELAFERGGFELDRLRAGQKVWKTDDPQLTSRLRKSFTGAKPQRRVPIDLTITAGVGRPLVIEARSVGIIAPRDASARRSRDAVGVADSDAPDGASGKGITRSDDAYIGSPVRVSSPDPLPEALKHPLTENLLREQLGRLGATVYELHALTAQIDGRPMIPLSVLGALRHKLVRKLDEAMRAPAPRRIAEGSALAELRAALPSDVERASRPVREGESPDSIAARTGLEARSTLRALVRSREQLNAVLAAGVPSLYVDFQDIREYREAVVAAHAAGAEIFIATPRIQKPAEMGIFHVLLRHGADGILVRNLAGLAFYAARNVPVVADFSLNCANDLTAQWLRERGAGRITASYDLNRDQLLDLVEHVPPEWLEVVVHQHMPMFHMEHCVFCAVLSPGTNKTNCGRPCDRHEVKLRDHLGMEHPLTADVGCRNTLFNAVAQSGAEVVPALLARGVRHFRVELLAETPAEIARTLDLYRRLLEGSISGKQVWSELQAANRVGVTRGTLEERRNPLAIL